MTLMHALRSQNEYFNPPSIPTAGDSYGYNEDKGKMSRNEPKKKGYTGLKFDAVGPDSYQSKTAFEKNRLNHVGFSISRSTFNTSQQEGPGPGNYELLTSHSDKNMSSVFKSTSQRLFDQRAGVFSNSFKKQRFKQKAVAMSQEDLFD